MAERTKPSFCFLCCSLLLLCSSAYSQQSDFQIPLLTTAPNPFSVAADIVEPPVLRPNLFLSDIPRVLTLSSEIARDEIHADVLVQKAEQHFQHGKRLYQTDDADEARKEFDRAIELMLEASENNPPDRNDFQRKFDQMVDAIHRYDVAGLGASADVENASFEEAPLEDILKMTFPVDPKLKNKVRAQVQATVSQLPLMVNDGVLGYIHYLSGRGRKTMIAGLERMGRYKPLIQRILDEEGIPPELIHLAQAESGFMPRAMSRAKAGGMWQFLAWRGQEYGLMRTKYKDDRYDPEKATRAAAHHLRDLYNEFGDWYLAIAAYNCGPGTVEKAVERTGYADFWKLRDLHVLPAETTNYVPIIVAMTIMDKNATEYGLDNVVPDPPIQYDTVQITSPTSLALAGDLTDTPLPELLSLNPALLKTLAPAGYLLHVPKGTGSRLMASLQMIPPNERLSWRLHTVEPGETLSSIGRHYGATAKAIASVNDIDLTIPEVGDRLVIPAAYKEQSAHKKRVSRRSRSRHSVRRTSYRHKSARRSTSKKSHISSKHRPKSSRRYTRTASETHRRKAIRD